MTLTDDLLNRNIKLEAIRRAAQELIDAMRDEGFDGNQTRVFNKWRALEQSLDRAADEVTPCRSN